MAGEKKKKKDFPCTLFHKHLHSLPLLSSLTSSFHIHSQHGYLFWRKIFEQLCKCMYGNAQYSMEMDWRENGLIKDRWHRRWKPFVLCAERHFRQCQNLRDVRYVFHTKHYLLWWHSSWLFKHVDDYKWVEAYFSVWTVAYRFVLIGIYIFLFVQAMADAQHFLILPHFPFTLVLTDIMDHCETF